MRILVISNLYPPYYIGGYELACKDVVDGLRKRGHEIVVLTSTYGIDKPMQEDGVYRILNHYFDFDKRPKRRFLSRIDSWKAGYFDWENYRLTKRVIKQVKPDILYLWHLGMLSPSVMFAAESVKIPLVYHIFDYWLKNVVNNFRVASSGLKQYIKSITISREIRRLGLEHLIFGSERLRQLYIEGGVPLKDTRIIYHGIDAKQYLLSESHTSEEGACKLLYAGRVSPEKGVRIIIEAISTLTQKGYEGFSLSIVGGGSSDYVSELQRLVEENKLKQRIKFWGMQPREEVKDFFQNHDIFIFSSIWEEPFGIVILEAMASGMSVIGTAVGGSKEILVDGENALVYPPRDSEALAEAIYKLANDAELRKRLGKKAAQCVRERFDIEQTIEQVEQYLLQVCE